MSCCTWEACTSQGLFEQKGKSGVWAKLCKPHDEQLEAALKSGNGRLILACWVRAQGGSKAAARRMVGG